MQNSFEKWPDDLAIEQCRQLCLDETSFVCMSYAYTALLDCKLSDTTETMGATLYKPCTPNIPNSISSYATYYAERLVGACSPTNSRCTVTQEMFAAI